MKRCDKLVGCVLALFLILTCIGCETAGKTGALIGAVTGAAIGASIDPDHRVEGALIGGIIGGGSGYLIGSNIDRKKQRKLMLEYDSLMAMKKRQAVNRRITVIADRVLGNRDGYTSAQERDDAIVELGRALDTAADEHGNRNGKTEYMERERYLKRYRHLPLIKILSGR